MDRRREEKSDGTTGRRHRSLAPARPDPILKPVDLRGVVGDHAPTGEVDSKRPSSSHRGRDLGARELLSIQRSAGNQAVVHLLDAKAGPSTAGAETKEVNPPPGPYTGRRIRNDKLDKYESNKHLFKPGIFKEYGPYPEEWAPLDSYLKRVWVTNAGSDAGIRLNADLRKSMLGILERFISVKAADIRKTRPGRAQDDALRNAIWGESGKQYTFARRRAWADYLGSNYRHFHEWAAVRFGLVGPPYAYHAKRKAAK